MGDCKMQKKGWLVLLCLLLVAGAASDHYSSQQERENGQGGVTVTAPFHPQYTSNDIPQSSVDVVARLCNISGFRKQYHTSGSGQHIALIDSGIDLSHEALRDNQNGSTKVIVYRDFTQEGMLYSQAVSVQDNKVTISGTAYYVGNIVNNAQQYRIAFLRLGEIQPKIFPDTEQQLAVLIVAEGAQYDCVYIDTNQNCDFTDETALHCYQEKKEQLTLHSAGYNLNLALTSIAEDGSQLQLTADTLGHGTFLAGLIAANGADYQGLAPQAQLCVYKIFNREGQSSQIQLAQAIRAAILDGADCINLSLSIPKDEAICPELEEMLNQARAANIPLIAAAGNYGPGKNTIAYPARAESVLGIGSYVAPEMYAQDKALMLQKPFITDYSGRGTQDGACAPLLVAPAGMLSTVPAWYSQSYLYDYGTSISAAVVTAAVTHVQEAAKKRNLLISVEQLQDLLASWARDLEFSAAEQGYGALRLGKLPYQTDKILKRDGLRTQTVVYKKEDVLTWQFHISQGQSQSWYVQVEPGMKGLSAIIQIKQQQPSTEQEHLIAMGRCRISLYDPEGSLVEETEYLGASYSREIVTSGAVETQHPSAGIWEIVVTSADNLSQYNHVASEGVLKVELK